MRKSIPWIMERLPDISDMNILDVGGIRQGRIEPAAMELLERGHKVYTADIAAPNYPEFRYPDKWDYCVGDILDIAHTLGQNSYDMVLAIHVLQHIGMPWRGMEKVMNSLGDRAFLSHVQRLLVQGGVAFIETSIRTETDAAATFALKWDNLTTWKVYTEEWLRDAIIGVGLNWADHMIYDGANDSRKRMKDAKAIVIMVQK